MKKTGLAILSILTLALLAVFWHRQEPPAPLAAPAKPPAPVAASQPAAPAAPIRAFQWPAGTRQAYRYQLSTDVRVNTSMSRHNAQWQEVPLRLDGVLNLRVFGAEEGRIYLGFQLAPVAVIYGGQAVPLLQRLYGAVFMAAVSPQGEFLKFYFPAYMSAPEEQIPLSELVNMAQTVLPAANPPPPRWDSEESHASGVYRASYRWQGDSLEKQKTAYASVSTLTQSAWRGLRLEGKVLASKADIRLGGQHAWLESLALEEKAVFSSDQGTLAESAHQLALRRTAEPLEAGLEIWRLPASPAPAREYLAAMRTLPEGGGTAWETMRLERLRQTYAGTAAGDVLSELSQASNAEQRAAFGRKLQEYLQAYPDATSEVARQLRQTLYPKEITGAVVSVLENLGHLPAQQALLELLADARPEADYMAMQAAVGAGGIQQPDPALVDGLWRHVAEGGREYDTALLSLGRLSATLESVGDTATAQQIQEQLSAYLQQPGISERDQTLALKSLANAANPETYPAIAPYLSAKDTGVRAAAHQVPREFSDATSREVLLNSLRHDEAALVRQTALDSLARRPDQGSPETIAGVAQALPLETDETLRAGMIRFLGRQQAMEPAATAALQQQLSQESSREMLKEVYKALYQPAGKK
jgi:hypothetical protein